VKHKPRAKRLEGGEYRAQCPCGWVGDFWFSKDSAEREAEAHRANP
jgi:hypothetical protein